MATQSKDAGSPSITVPLMGGIARGVSPGTFPPGGTTPGLNDLTSLSGFRLVKHYIVLDTFYQGGEFLIAVNFTERKIKLLFKPNSTFLIG